MIFKGIKWRRQHKVAERYNDTPYVEFYNRATGETLNVTHSRTDMAFVEGGREHGRGYLLHDGTVYTAAPAKIRADRNI